MSSTENKNDGRDVAIIYTPNAEKESDIIHGREFQNLYEQVQENRKTLETNFDKIHACNLRIEKRLDDQHEEFKVWIQEIKKTMDPIIEERNERITITTENREDRRDMRKELFRVVPHVLTAVITAAAVLVFKLAGG